MMLMMNLSSHHITHPNNYLLYSDLVWVIIRVLLIKPPLIFWVLITVEWVENRIKVYQINRVSKFIAAEGTAGWQKTAQSRIGLIYICYSRPPRKNFRALWG